MGNWEGFGAFWASLDGSTAVLVQLTVMLLGAFLLSQLTRRLKLPNVTAYLLAGVVIGPHALNLVSQEMISSMDFVTDLALSLIAFGVGRYFKWGSLKKSGPKVVLLTAAEALSAALLVGVVLIFVFKLPLELALMLAAIASATASTSTLMTIRQYRAKGHFVKRLLQVVALDDVVALICFSLCAAIAQVEEGQAVSGWLLALPVAYNLLSVILGAGMGLVLKGALQRLHSAYNRLLLTVVLLLMMGGMCGMMEVSPLLGCMAMGAVYANTAKGNQLFKLTEKFSPPILTCFFVISGMKLDLGALSSAGLIGVAYFIARIVGKYLGALWGAAAIRETREVRRYLGLALIPQAGVSIGLAALGERILPEEMGAMLSNIILASAVLYELVGPALAKLSLRLAGAIKPRERSAQQQREEKGQDQTPQAEQPRESLSAACR